MPDRRALLKNLALSLGVSLHDISRPSSAQDRNRHDERPYEHPEDSQFDHRIPECGRPGGHTHCMEEFNEHQHRKHLVEHLEG
jgi:hypothetical protein